MVKNKMNVQSKDRTCESCRRCFDTVRGLNLHQKNKIFVACYRAGVRKRLLKVNTVRESHFAKAKNRVIPKNHRSVAVKRPKGKPVSAGEKQIMLNVYDYFRNKKNMAVKEVNWEFDKNIDWPIDELDTCLISRILHESTRILYCSLCHRRLWKARRHSLVHKMMMLQCHFVNKTFGAFEMLVFIR